jgi:hypothetical protein
MNSIWAQSCSSPTTACLACMTKAIARATMMIKSMSMIVLIRNRFISHLSRLILALAQDRVNRLTTQINSTTFHSVLLIAGSLDVRMGTRSLGPSRVIVIRPI